jgi:hypothetical protein
MTPRFDDRSESRTQRIPVSFASNDRSESGFHDHRESTWVHPRDLPTSNPVILKPIR